MLGESASWSSLLAESTSRLEPSLAKSELESVRRLAESYHVPHPLLREFM